MALPSFPNIDLFSAGINALNGVLVARNPSHNRGYTAAGLLIMAFFGGIGGVRARAVPLPGSPSPLWNPGYLLVRVFVGVVGEVAFRLLRSKEGGVPRRPLRYLKCH